MKVGFKTRVSEIELWSDIWMQRASGRECVVERERDVKSEWLKGNCGATVGCKERVAEKVL